MGRSFGAPRAGGGTESRGGRRERVRGEREEGLGYKIFECARVVG
jgi:hypothetical protein